VLSLDKLDYGAARSTRGAATLGVETGLDDEVRLNTNGDANEVTARSTTGSAGVRPISEGTEPTRRTEVVLEEQGGARVTHDPAEGWRPANETQAWQGHRPPTRAPHARGPRTQPGAGLQLAGPSLPLIPGRELGLLS
jgi:hypothetical protein